MILDFTLVLIIASLLLPLFSFFVLFSSAKVLPRKGDWLAVVFSGISLLIASTLFSIIVDKPQLQHIYSFKWFSIGSKAFEINLLLSGTSSLMLLVVCFIAFLVNIYSVEYMKGKVNYERYFPYLSIFTFAMIGIVLSNNLLITFMFWELVGFSSYLLIGFWFDKDAAVKASKKAFLFNRIGDIGFLLALLLIYVHFETFSLTEIEAIIKASITSNLFPIWLSLAGFGLFAACVGKSAQFPLQVWLPDAMEGPTPVSALIHAATMVAAGVYLMVKVYFLLSPEVKIFMVCTGTVTALIGAVPALFQYDIKKILAYSTISQLGYMVMGLGLDTYVPSFFHLITHAFFKANLFLSAGIIIHTMHDLKHHSFKKGIYIDFDAQDIRFMGGLFKKIPLTFLSFFISACALVGIPFSSGALSKELILHELLVWASLHGQDNLLLFWIIPFIAFSTMVITTVYVFRLVYWVFFSHFRLTEIYPELDKSWDSIKEHHWFLIIPVIILSIFSAWLVFSYNPLISNQSWLINVIDTNNTFPREGAVSIWPYIMIVLGLIISFVWIKQQRKTMIYFKSNGYNNSPQWIKAIRNDWKMDAFYYHFLVKTGFQFSGYVTLMDRKLIDPFIHFIATSNVVLAHISSWIDRYLLDGVISSLVSITKLMGLILSKIQNGKVQEYLLYSIIILLVVALSIMANNW